MAETCTIRLLGGFLVDIDGRRVPGDAWRHRRGADLVKLLALAPGHRLHRDQVMDALWPDLPQDAAAANLRKAVHFARRALGGEGTIGLGASMVVLWPGADLRVDAERFETAARGALATGGAAHAVTVELFTGDLLPEDRYADWTEPHRERIRRRCLDLLRSTGRWEQVLEIDSADEEAHRALMRSYLEAGNRQAAIRQFRRLRDVLRVDLGVGPDQETVALFERALDMEGPEAPIPAERAGALIARGLVHWNRQELDEAQRAAQEARMLALEHGLGRELGEASALLGLVAFARGCWRELFHEEFVQALHQAPHQAPFVFDAHVCFAEACLYGADSRAIVESAHELLAVAEQAGSVHGRALMTLLIGEAELLGGCLDVAEERLSRAAALFAQLDAVSGQGLAHLRLAEVAIARDRRAEAAPLLVKARRFAERSELVSHLLVRVFDTSIRAAGCRAQQIRAVEEAERVLPPRQFCGPCSIGFRVASTIAWARAGDTARARSCLGEAERLAGMWQGGPWIAATWEARAALRRAEGDHEQSAALLREAAELFAQSGRPIDAARCRMGAGLTA